MILNQQGLPFSTLSEQDRCIALSAYVREMLEIGRQGKRNCTSRGMKLILLGQLEKALKDQFLKGLVVEKRVNPLLTCYEPLWTGKKINEEIARGINNIFQRTQTNYATDWGINNAVYGFRMVGQSQIGAVNPFFLGEKPGLDMICSRLSFLLRHAQSKKAEALSCITGKTVGEDLAACWQYCATACLEELRSGVVDEKKIEAVYRSGDVLAGLHPQNLGRRIGQQGAEWIRDLIDNAKQCKYGNVVSTLASNVYLKSLAQQSGRKQDFGPTHRIKM